MFTAAIATELPYHDSKMDLSAEEGENVRVLQNKISSDLTLDTADLDVLSNSIRNTSKRQKTHFCKALCYMKFLCKKDKAMQALRGTSKVFEESLDIRRLVDDHFHLNLLLSLLLSSE